MYRVSGTTDPVIIVTKYKRLSLSLLLFSVGLRVWLKAHRLRQHQDQNQSWEAGRRRQRLSIDWFCSIESLRRVIVKTWSSHHRPALHFHRPLAPQSLSIYSFSSTRPCLKNIRMGSWVPSSLSRYSSRQMVASQSIDSPVKNCRSLNRGRMSLTAFCTFVLKVSTWSGFFFSNSATTLERRQRNKLDGESRGCETGFTPCSDCSKFQVANGAF